ncbi:MAG: hypothetical protein HUU31_15460 [Anaerolineae bacterium]|nr:hypothetical protein [Anaerolineae bacterium]
MPDWVVLPELGFEPAPRKKKALETVLPHSILYRPKKGFGIPLAQWLKNELKPLLLEVLHPDKIKKEGLFNPQTVTSLVSAHLEGRANNRKQLFSLLMFELWLAHYGLAS